ncbi:hypothetical protein HA402_005731 [Bradysia odoriphaga]|nr:hypothetical protein HA402_005731 [Bradysia odoriphaga]
MNTLQYQLMLVFIFIFSWLIDLNAGDKHEYGEYTGHYDNDGRRFFRRTVIDDSNKIAKNYTLYYKYFGSKYRDVQYFEIDVNVPSTGYVQVYNHENVHATIHIDNAYRVTAIISIYGSLPASIPKYGGFGRSAYIQKSLTYINVKNATRANTGTKIANKNYENSIGARRRDDQLLYFESKNVRNNSRFPSRSVSYSADDEYINYVGFSFDSPTAVVLINTTFVGEKEFNAVVYDMNAEHLVVNMSVYGVRGRRPNGFVGVK